MKFLIIVLLSMTCVERAIAMPNVGDYAVYSVREVSGSTRIISKVTLEIIRFDPVSKKYRVRRSVTQNSVTQGLKQVIEDSDTNELLSDEVLRQTMLFCEDDHGVMADVKTPAGEFRSCAKESYDGPDTVTTWYAENVSFGILKSKLTKANGDTKTTELVSYKLPQASEYFADQVKASVLASEKFKQVGIPEEKIFWRRMSCAKDQNQKGYICKVPNGARKHCPYGDEGRDQFSEVDLVVETEDDGVLRSPTSFSQNCF